MLKVNNAFRTFRSYLVNCLIRDPQVIGWCLTESSASPTEAGDPRIVSFWLILEKGNIGVKHSRAVFPFLILSCGCFFIAFRGKERKGEREKHQLVAFLYMPPPGNRTCDLGMCPDWESNLWPFSLRDDAPTHWVTGARARAVFLLVQAQPATEYPGCLCISYSLLTYSGPLNPVPRSGAGESAFLPNASSWSLGSYYPGALWGIPLSPQKALRNSRTAGSKE